MIRVNTTRSLVAALCVPPAAFGMLAVYETLWLRTVRDVAPRDLTLPIIVATEWHAAGMQVFTLASFALASAVAIYALVINAICRQDVHVPLRAICVSAAASLIAIILCPVLFSSDLYAYAAYGHMAALNINPYAPAHLRALDPLFSAAVQQWNNPMPVCVYGPLFVSIAKMATILGAPGGVFLQLLFLRCAACIALLCCAPLAFAAFAPCGRRVQELACAGIVLNPVALWSASEGHNDPIMLAIVLSGFIVARRYSAAAGAFIIGLSTLVKATGIAAAATIAVFYLRDTNRLLKITAGTTVALLVFAVAMVPYASAWPDIVRIALHGVHYTPQFSLQYLLGVFFTQVFGDHSLGYHLGVTLALCAGGLIALYGLGRLARHDTSGAAYFAFGLWIALPNAYPWYALWILPTAFLAMRSRMFWVIVVASISIFARYVLDIVVSSNTDIGIWVTLIAIGIPCALLIRKAPVVSSVALESDAVA